MNQFLRTKLSSSFFILLTALFPTLMGFVLVEKIKAKVIGVKDGDTVEVLYQSQPVKVRLYGIDCPEKKQDFGSRAQQYTSSCCFGKDVQVITHGKDKYRRLLGEIILPDGKNLNQLLVQNGFAWRYKFSKDPLLKKLEDEARNKKKGLWALNDPQPPWDFRAESRAKAKKIK